MWKHISKRVASAMHIVGDEGMALLAPEVNNTKNDQSRSGGFAPSQWVIGKLPHRPGDQFDEETWADLGILSAKLDSDGAFALQQELKLEARMAFVKVQSDTEKISADSGQAHCR